MLSGIEKGIELLQQAGNGLLQHSLRVAELTADVLLQNPKLTGNIAPKNIVIAALLHDLGKTKWDKELFIKPYHQLTFEQHYHMQQHPIIGAEIARELNISEDIIMLIEQHHERDGGQGYPNGIKDPHPAALLIGTCDAYAACRETRAYRPEPLPKCEALREAARVSCEAIARILEKIG